MNKLKETTNLMCSNDLQLVAKKWLELLLQTESESKPSHVSSIPPLPEIDHAFEIILHGFVFLCILFALLFWFGFQWDPIAAQEDVTVLGIELPCFVN